MRSRVVDVAAPGPEDCIFCGSGHGCGCRSLRNRRRRNPDDLASRIVDSLGPDARVAFERGLALEQIPRRRGDFRPWAIQGDDFWSREWYVPGWLIKDRTLSRTVWRFDEDGGKERIEAIEVDDPSYFALMEGYGEDYRVSSWRDYFTWVIQHGKDPLDELKIEEEPSERLERWACTVRDFEKGGRSVGVELVGARAPGSPGPLRTPESLPRHVRDWFRAVRDDSNGAWILMDGYRNVEDFASDVAGRRGVEMDGGPMRGACRFVLEIEGPASGLTPRTELVRQAAVEALRALTV